MPGRHRELPYVNMDNSLAASAAFADISFASPFCSSQESHFGVCVVVDDRLFGKSPTLVLEPFFFSSLARFVDDYVFVLVLVQVTPFTTCARPAMRPKMRAEMIVTFATNICPAKIAHFVTALADELVTARVLDERQTTERAGPFDGV